MTFQKKFILTAVVLLYAGSVYGQRQHRLLPDQSITFTVLNAGVAVEGTMKLVKGEFVMDSRRRNQIYVMADASTVNTGIAIRDKHLRKSDYFDVNSSPLIIMRSTKLRIRDSLIKAEFDLTIKNITRPVEVTFRKSKKGDLITYEGSFEINRLEFNLGEESIILDEVVRIEFSLTAR